MLKTPLSKSIAVGLASLALFGAIQANTTSADETADDLAAVLAARPVPANTPAKDFGQATATETPASNTEAVITGATFFPISPYRTFDSRQYVDGFMFGGDEIYFDVLTDTTGAVRLPSNTVAVTYNLTATGTGGSGYLAIYPGNVSWPGNSSINWTATGQVIANGGAVAVGVYDAPGQVRILCGPAGLRGTDFILDITGYYLAVV